MPPMLINNYPRVTGVFPIKKIVLSYHGPFGTISLSQFIFVSLFFSKFPSSKTVKFRLVLFDVRFSVLFVVGLKLFGLVSGIISS